MDYEKKYKAVLKTATQWIKDGCTDKEKICLECVFPELRESEDERIRKELVEYHKQQLENNRDQEIGLFHKDALAYLERQKEQEHICDSVQFEEGFKTGLEIGLRKQKEQKSVESENERMIKAITHILYENYTDAAVIEGVEIAEIVTWLEERKEPQWKPSEEQIVNATYNDLCEVYEKIRAEMLRRHQDIAINIKEGQR